MSKGKKNQSEETNQAQEQDSDITQLLKLNREFKTTMMNMLRALSRQPSRTGV